MLEDAILVALGMNDVAVIGSPEGTATAIMSMPAVGSGICLSNHISNKTATDTTTDSLDTDGVPIVPAFIPVIHFSLRLQRFKDNAEIPFVVLQMDDVVSPVNYYSSHIVSPPFVFHRCSNIRGRSHTCTPGIPHTSTAAC